ncbi:four helix bundle protein [Mariprofundus ferrooxydans]|uniref:four helix bundle protein n=1 Tax=Mariprofundus ferrooxydans TaxID=314344 RepID=UPI001430CE56|nr:four helix bundle protein [Mariprofundus ferrooxydans]
MKSHKDLDVWKKALDLSVEVYRLTGSFPKDEVYAMTSQMRRAAVSIASNIAEGAARRTDKDFIHFLHTALGSASELDTQIEIVARVGLADKEKIQVLQSEVGVISKMLCGLIRSVENKKHD